jgi:signal transduction histidine kinase
MAASIGPRESVPRSSRMGPIGLNVAGLAATGLVLLAVLLDVQAAPYLRDGWTRLTSVLVALGALCVIGLTVRRARSVAWIAAILAAVLASTEAIGAVRAQELAGLGSPWFVAVAGPARLTAAAVALAYGLARTRSRHGSLTTAGIALVLAANGVVVIEVAVVGLWITAGAAIDSWPQRIANRSLLAFVALATALGAIADLRGPLGNARLRFGEPITPSRAPAFLAVLADELVPLRRSARREALQAERARLAADLHAEVLPELRSALATAQALAVPPAMGQHLERAVDQIEELMSARRSVVLESLGLVAALEWLAERTEARSAVRVQLDLGDDDEAASAPPIGVQRAAFRVAQLALDNVVRHADAATAAVSLAGDASRFELRIVDDGVGFTPGASTWGRGIADMRAESDAVQAGLAVASGSGTTVEFRWPR